MTSPLAKTAALAGTVAVAIIIIIIIAVVANLTLCLDAAAIHATSSSGGPASP